MIGLDPASRLYSMADRGSRITNDSAKYVECIHTGFWLGTRDPFCQVDFFVNGGMRQPKCVNFIGLDNVFCSHKKAVQIYMETFENPKTFKAEKCENLEEALASTCRSDQYAYINDEENSKNSLTGIYHVKTN